MVLKTECVRECVCVWMDRRREGPTHVGGDFIVGSVNVLHARISASLELIAHFLKESRIVCHHGATVEGF